MNAVIGVILLLGIEFVIALSIVAPLGDDGEFPLGEDIAGECLCEPMVDWEGKPCTPISVGDRVVAWKCEVKPEAMRPRV